MKTEMVIGKYTLESLTNGMYSSPLDLYREYIQNAVDSIDEAVAQELISSDEARIDIAVNTESGKISIRDNGTGIPLARALQTLVETLKKINVEIVDSEESADWQDWVIAIL